MDGCIYLRSGGSRDNLPFKIGVYTHAHPHTYIHTHTNIHAHTDKSLTIKLTKLYFEKYNTI